MAVSGKHLFQNIYYLPVENWISGYTFRDKKIDGETPEFDKGDIPVKVVLHFRRI